MEYEGDSASGEDVRKLVETLLVGQASGLFLVGTRITLLISLAILIINVILLQRIMKYNDRFVLFEKQI